MLEKVFTHQLEKLPRYHKKAWWTIRRAVEVKGTANFRFYKVKSHRKKFALVGQPEFEMQMFIRNDQADKMAVAAAKAIGLPDSVHKWYADERTKNEMISVMFDRSCQNEGRRH